MAVLHIQENIQKADGTYDVVHKETEAGLVLFDDNKSLQQKYDAGELNGQDIYAEAVAKGYTGTEDEFYAMLASGPWVPGVKRGTGYVAQLESLKLRNVNYDAGINMLPNLEDTDINGNPALKLLGDFLDGEIKITNVGSPVNDSDAATKKYVDDAVANAGGSGGASDRVLADLVLVRYAQTGSSTWGYERTSSFRYDSDYNGVGLDVTVELIRRPELDHPNWGAYYTVNGPIVIDRLAASWKKIDAFALVPRDSSKYAKYYTPMDRYGHTTSISAIYTQLECTSLYLQEIAYAQLNALDGTGSLLAANLASKDNILIAKASTENPYMNARTFILPQLGVYLNE